jgi:serine protease Do
MKFLRFLLVNLALFALAVPSAMADAKVPQTRADLQYSFAPLVKKAAPAVVNIYTRKVVEQVVRSPLFDDPFFRRFFGDSFGGDLGRRRKRMENSLGSGVILSNDGLIVTNHHVIEGADSITVAMSDRREFEAELVLDDERTDLAVLRIDAEGEQLPFLRLRDSDTVEVGDLVLAIGNPFNVGQTVTSGIVSALARTQVGVSDFQFFIQTDAAINPGNSGGALIGVDGRLIGVNTAIFSKTGGSHGIGFAVPSNMVRAVIQSAKAGHRTVRRPWLGANTQTVSAEIASSIGLERPEGVLIRAIYPGGPADRAGLKVGDVMQRVDGRPIDSPRALNFRLATKGIGGKAKLDIWRQGKTSVREMDLIVAPESPSRNERELTGRHPLSGAVVGNLSPALAEELGMDTLATGVVVLKLRSRSAAARLRLRQGDRILRVNGRKIETVEVLKRALDRARDGWEITVRRGNENTTIRIAA